MSSKSILCVIFLFLRCTHVIKSEPIDCGRQKLNTVELIVNGYETKPGQFPWHVAIFHLNNRRGRDYACGGTLVNEYQTITAAHCVIDPYTLDVYYPDIVLLQFGIYDLDVSSTHTIEQKAFQIVIHENYEHDVHKNDIAIVTTRSKIKFSPYIQPSCIWNDDIETLASHKKLAVAPGFGITEKDELSNTLRAANLPIIGFYECFDSNREIFFKVLTRDNFCAGYRNGTTLCNGDSGGGMYVKYKGRWFLTGVVSFSVLRENGQPFCSKNNYGVLVNVQKFSLWLRNHLLPNSGIGPNKNINYDQVSFGKITTQARLSGTSESSKSKIESGSLRKSAQSKYNLRYLR